MSAPAATTIRAASAIARGLGAEELDRERMLVGGDAQVAERALVAVLDAGAADHLRADEARAEAPSLAPERLHADARHRREHEPRRHLDGADPPGFAKVDHAIGTWYGLAAACVLTARRVRATIPARVGAPRRALPFTRVCLEAFAVKDVILTPEGYEKLKQELDDLRTTRRREVAERIRVRP